MSDEKKKKRDYQRFTWGYHDVQFTPEQEKGPGEPLCPPEQLKQALSDLDDIIAKEKEFGTDVIPPNDDADDGTSDASTKDSVKRKTHVHIHR